MENLFSKISIGFNCDLPKTSESFAIHVEAIVLKAGERSHKPFLQLIFVIKSRFVILRFNSIPHFINKGGADSGVSRPDIKG